ncbi:MAG: transposase [Cyanobacteria bacterium P01_D01_bin.44]
MKLTYQYKLRPTLEQAATLQSWLDMLRDQYNWMLADRFDWWQFNRCPVNACSLVQGPARLRDTPDYYSQKKTLPSLKQERPWYRGIHSQVLQEVAKQVKTTFERYLKGDSQGKRSGRPRFKGKQRYRTFTYPQIKANCIGNGRITLPKIGAVKLIQHRPVPDGFMIKTAKVTHKADGWYVSLLLESKDIPETLPNVDTSKAVGIDLGLKDFIATSEGEYIPIPQYFRKSEQRLAKLQRQLARKQKFSTRWRKQVSRIAKLHQTVARQRRDFFSKVWDWLLNKYDIVVHEKLNIKGLVRTRLAKSIADAAWGTFLKMGVWKAAKAAKLTIAVNPNRTTVDCSGCGAQVAKTLADRLHQCDGCGLSLNRDHNAAINIKQRGVGHQPLNLSDNVLALAGSL